MARRLERYAWTAVLGVFLMGVSCAAHAQDTVAPAKAAAKATLVAAGSLNDAGDAIEVRVLLSGHGTEPSTIALKLFFDSTQLAFEAGSVVAGSAAVDSGKYVYGNLSATGEATFLVYGVNFDTIADGELFRATFALLHPQAPGGLLVGATNASVADVNGDGIGTNLVYFAPASVTASQDRSDGIAVSWSEVDGAVAYQVYRSASSDPSTAAALTDWGGSDTREYLDASEEALAAVGMQCSRVNRLYYWVRAVDASGEQGTLNAVAGQGAVASSKFSAGGSVADVLVLSLMAAVLMAWRRGARALNA